MVTADTTEIQDTCDQAFGLIETAKQQFIAQVVAFCNEHGVMAVQLTPPTVAYRDYHSKWFEFRIEVSIPDTPEKQQVPVLRKLETCWPQSAALRTRYATYHPTSKHKSRRLQLELSVYPK